MNKQRTTTFKDAAGFVLAATIYHTITYFVAGIISSSVFDYRTLFSLPVIADYFRPYDSIAVYTGPLLQLARGLLLGLALLPFRGFLAERRLGWLWLWLFIVAFAIVGTPAAAPASLEGVIYSKLPLWFHFVGLPEIGLQTLAFAYLVHRRLRAAGHPAPAWIQKTIQALVATCLSFIGYAAVSLAFAFASGIDASQTAPDAKVMGVFLGPVAATFGLLLAGGERSRLIRHIAMYLLSAAWIGLYQTFALGGTNPAYLLLAPVLPVAISWLVSRPSRTAATTAPAPAGR